jgi:hypothetical protein
MKNTGLKSAVLALALVSAVSSCSKKAEGFTINGKFSDVKDGIVYLQFEDGDKKTTDSTKITDGSRILFINLFIKMNSKKYLV